MGRPSRCTTRASSQMALSSIHLSVAGRCAAHSQPARAFTACTCIHSLHARSQPARAFAKCSRIHSLHKHSQLAHAFNDPGRLDAGITDAASLVKSKGANFATDRGKLRHAEALIMLSPRRGRICSAQPTEFKVEQVIQGWQASTGPNASTLC
eukprot:3859936-Pleurochrysis_carterae.AAC.1